MRYYDIVHGAVEIRDELLLELVTTDALRRIEGIHQTGATAYIYPRRSHTRFDHSMGVLLLLRRLRASWREQVAGLLHDISHTVFSHVIDKVFPATVDAPSFHETLYKDLLWGSEVPTVLAAYGLAVADVLDETPYTLLEQPLPALCADRLDYFLRDALMEGLLTPAHISRFLPHLVVHQGRIVMNDLVAARWLGYEYIRVDQLVWSNPLDICAYQILAETLQLALDAGFITTQTLLSTDDAVMTLLRSNPEPAIQDRLELLAPHIVYEVDSTDHDYMITIDKVRAIDPPVLMADACVPLSELDDEFRQAMAEHLARRGQVVPVRVRA
ncbi:MAG: HD domain-containing protein [Chloroflexi bacterium]|nr:HD domain-containing protein [Chloroflexota bacterium]MBU1751953.1 HD domain-containing protein [Chloroflexota bacterium]